MKKSNKLLLSIIALITLSTGAVAEKIDRGPAEGSLMPEIIGKTMHGENFQLSKLTDKGSVVLVMLRGYPGYQCPVCSAQVAGYVAKADEFEKQNTPVIFIYPGKVKNLDKRAKEFTAPLEETVDLPANLIFVIDQDYKITNLLDLRWNTPRETAYPAAFVVDHKGYIQYANVSNTHQGRATASEIIEFLEIIH